MAKPQPQVTFLEQFIRFGTDAYGLERILRLFQSLTALLLFSAPVRRLFLTTTSLLSRQPWTPSPSLLKTTTTTGPTDRDSASAAAAAVTLTTLLPPLRARLAALRQGIRVFRFLESFAAAWEAWNALGRESTSPLGTSSRLGAAEQWADLGAKAFTGMYLLLESAVFVEVVLDVPGLRVWATQEQVRGLVADGQRFWFLGLVCGVVGGVVRLWRVRGRGSEVEGEGRTGEKVGDGGGDDEKRRADLARAARERRKMIRKLVADVMDLAIPGSAVGWLPLAPVTVAWLMLGSTILTGMEVWERCGREVAVRKAAAAS